jgi:hypothetical protein
MHYHDHSRINGVAREDLSRAIKTTNKKNDYPRSQFYSDAVDQLVFAFTMNQLSTCPFPIVSERISTDDQRVSELFKPCQCIGLLLNFRGINLRKIQIFQLFCKAQWGLDVSWQMLNMWQ